MVDTRYLQELVIILKSNGVKHIKMQGLELSFHVEQILGMEQILGDSPINPNISSDSTQIIADTLRKQEEAMPPDLRADALMDQDKILNWSSPDQKAFDEEPSLPLTDEQPL